MHEIVSEIVYQMNTIQKLIKAVTPYSANFCNSLVEEKRRPLTLLDLYFL
jgi:hypothetical protein